MAITVTSEDVQLPMLTSTGQRSFSFHGPTVCNRLPSALRHGSSSLNTFVRQLKTYLDGRSAMRHAALMDGSTVLFESPYLRSHRIH